MGYQVIYGDVLFLINFSMDFLTLYLVGKLWHIPVKVLPVAVAAALGAASAVAAVIFAGFQVISVAIQIAVSLLMCFIAFSIKSVRTYIKIFISFYIIGLLFGGGITAAYSQIGKFVKADSLPEGIVQSRRGVFFLAVMLLFLLMYGISRRFVRNVSTAPVNTVVNIGGRRMLIKCISDSGNLLTEPISALPVIVCHESVLNQLHITREEIAKKFPSRFRVIPVDTANGSSLMYGILSDSVVFEQEGKETVKKAVIGFSGAAGLLRIREQCAGVVPSVLLQ